jgi:hypothetical protein
MPELYCWIEPSRAADKKEADPEGSAPGSRLEWLPAKKCLGALAKDHFFLDLGDAGDFRPGLVAKNTGD